MTTLKELMEKAVTLPLRFEPGDDENVPAITNEDGVVIFAEGDAPDDEREATAALIVHCVNNAELSLETIKSLRAVIQCFSMDGRPFVPKLEDPAWGMAVEALKVADAAILKLDTIPSGRRRGD